jgi:hypothetical protein
MEDFSISYRTKQTASGTTLSIPFGLKLPEVLRQKKASELQKKMKKRI